MVTRMALEGATRATQPINPMASLMNANANRPQMNSGNPWGAANPIKAAGGGIPMPAQVPPQGAISRPPAPQATAPRSYSSGGGGASYSPGTTLGTTATGQAAAVAQPMSDEDWWNSDADFQVEQAGLKGNLDNALAALTAKRAGYDTDFVSTLKNLGWDWNGDDAGNLADVAGGKWDPTNKLGAYGSGLNNLNNDFAGRGMMDSSFFGDALTNFNTDFNNQFKNVGQQRTQFLNDYGDNTGQGLAARNEFQNALARARQSSLARRDVAI